MLSAFFPAISGRKQRVPTRLQYQTTECGVAALAMILAHHGRYETMEGVRRVTGVSRDCVNAGDMVRAARHYGLESKAFSREPDALADLPVPFLAHLRFIHFVVVEGFSDDYVLTNDPAVGRSRIPREKFAEDFTGVALTFKPGPGFVPQGNNPNPLLGFWQRLTVAAKRNLGAVVLARCVAATLMVVFAWAFGAWFDALFAPGGDPAAAGAASLFAWMLSLALANALVLAGERHTTDQLFQRMAVDQARGLAHHMVALPNRFFAYRLPDKLRATLYAGAAVASLLCQRLLPDVLGIVSMGTAWIALVYLEPGLAALLAAVVLALGVAAALIFWRAGDWLRLRHSATAGSAGAMFMEPEELERSKFAGRDQDFVNARLSASAALQKSRQEGGVVAAVLRGLASGAVLLGVSLALVYVNGLVVSGEVGMGTAFTLLVLTLMVTAPLGGITRIFHEVDMLWHELLPVDDVLACSAGEEGGTAPLVSDLPNNLVLRAHQLVFGYSPNRPPQIDGIDLELRQGEQLGLTGPSGGGKSTLAGVLAGQHRCTAGTLAYAAHATVAWVDKGSFFFEGTVRDNLCLWQEGISPDAIQRAVQDACLDDVLQARPGGLDARVEQRGRNFSGGQRQRMEIARALLREPRILILDEATDGLDPALELRIRANIRKRGCALIMVSHRASTLAACDRVLRVAAGKLESFDLHYSKQTLDASDAQVPAGPPVARRALRGIDCVGPSGLLAAAVGRDRGSHWVCRPRRQLACCG
jgi:ABC-type bacteriocin/lantibiotic exporter with double-glycine peptidase domain